MIPLWDVLLHLHLALNLVTHQLHKKLNISGALNPNNAKKFIEMQFNRGYSQPIATGSYTAWGDPTRSRIAYYAARWDMDCLKIIAMRVDAARTPLVVLRRQIWLARFEYR